MADDASSTVKDRAMTQISRRLVTEILRTCNEQSKLYGREFASDLSTHFVACYIGAIAFNTLAFKPDKKLTDKQLYDIVANNFMELKNKIQESVAAGFTGAMKTHTGKEVEYYCTVRVVPPVANTKPC